MFVIVELPFRFVENQALSSFCLSCNHDLVPHGVIH